MRLAKPFVCVYLYPDDFYISTWAGKLCNLHANVMCDLCGNAYCYTHWGTHVENPCEAPF